MVMLIKLYDENPNPKTIRKIADVLVEGGIIIYPTDTVYGLGCDITNQKAVEKIAKLKGLKIENTNLSFICSDLSHLSDYTRPIPNHIFKLMKKYLPGPFTFILEANNNVPKYFKGKKKTVGIRIPDNNIIRAIVEELGHPILSTSIHDDDEILEYITDPELIYEKYQDIADIVIDGGYGHLIPSTVVDCTGLVPEIVRQGKGEIDL
jgi:tRNA threonylcarbamoyl adenosine modification protein (Sua5/YciO/YrdC/YwlC family)